jgi:hypothetical protein
VAAKRGIERALLRSLSNVDESEPCKMVILSSEKGYGSTSERTSRILISIPHCD